MKKKAWLALILTVALVFTQFAGVLPTSMVATAAEEDENSYVNDFISADSIVPWGTETNDVTVAASEGNLNITSNQKDYEKPKVTVFKDTASPMMSDVLLNTKFQITAESGQYGVAMRADSDRYITVNYNLEDKKWYLQWTYALDHSKIFNLSTSQELDLTKEHSMQVSLKGSVMNLWVDGAKIASNDMGAWGDSYIECKEPGYVGFIASGVGSATFSDFSVVNLSPAKPTAEKINTIGSDSMSVAIDEYFPRVKTYTMADGRVVAGRLAPINSMIINDSLPAVFNPSDVTFTKVSASEAQYKMHLKAGKVDAIIDASFKVEDNILTFHITNIENKGQQPINFLFIPDWSLVSVSNKGGATGELMGTRMAQTPATKGDTRTVIDDTYKATNSSTDWQYAFVSNSVMSAGISSNSENNGQRRITSTSYTVTEGDQEYSAVGLQSSRWIIQAPEMDTQNATKPMTKVVITGDANANGVINWQDGAIAFRNIMENPKGWEEVANSVSARVVQNFASLSSFPFLKELDTTKRVYLNTDGLGQRILMKGYGGEGHDSNHSDYGNVGKRIGGAADFNTLIDEGAKYGAIYGVHINDTETYPEAASFDPAFLRGNKPHTMGKPYGWSWLDSSYYIDTLLDYVSGSRMSRLTSLKNQVPNLDFIYVDVWYGYSSSADKMSQSGAGWETEKFADEIYSLDYNLATEWAAAFEGQALWTHWPNDIGYGGVGPTSTKGYNSEVVRFIANHQRDVWMANGPANRGAMVGPLLGGVDMADFEGWQDRHNYGQFVRTMFTDNLPTKFLQHYTVNSWENFADGTEKEIQLVSADNSQKIVVSRGEMPEGSAINGSRVMTLNGKVFLRDNQVINSSYRDTPHTSYLIPWTWSDGDLNANDTERLYHWNTDGGSTTWELPDGWNTLSTVKMYTLTDTGRAEETTLEVKEGKLTIEAKAETPYVFYKGEAAKAIVEYGLGQHLIDPSFNAKNLNAWTVTGDGASVDGMDNYTPSLKAQDGDPRLMIRDNTETTTVSQTLSGLTPGKEYSAMVYVQNDAADAKAYLEINAGGTVKQAYTEKSMINMWAGVDPHYSTKMHRVYVHFTAPADGSAVTLTLKREPGAAPAYFDDVKILEDDMNNWASDDVFIQDFEDNKPGIYPFVNGSGDTNQYAHRSERHDPYTQRGWTWDVTGVTNKINDVINGNWGVKVHAGYNRISNIIFQTLPQTIRFEPGVTYDVSFKYEFVTAGEYQVAIGDGSSTKMQLIPLETTPDGYKTARFTVTGAESGQTWFGIYAKVNRSGMTEATAAAGTDDFVLDDLVVSKGTLPDVRAIIDANILNGITIQPGSSLPKDVKVRLTDNSVLKANVDWNLEGIDLNTPGEYTINGSLTGLMGIVANYDNLTVTLKVTVRVDRSTLGIVIDLANGCKEEADKTIDSVKNEFYAALENAQAIYDDANSTQAQVDGAWKRLMNVIQALSFVPGDKSKLENLVTDCKGLSLSGYEDGAQKDAFVAALAQAEAMLLDKDAMQADLDDMYNKLAAAMDSLIPLPIGNKDRLKEAIDEAQSYDLSKYVDDANAKKAFADALDAAVKVMEKEEARQDEIDKARLNLLTAMSGLRLRADKASLNEWIDKLNAMDLSKYTAESVNAFRAVIARAQALADRDLGVDEADMINAMVGELANAQKLLILSSGETEQPDSSKPDSGKPDSSKPSGKPSGKPSTTGDNGAALIAGLGLIGAFGALLVGKKVKKDRKD